MAKSNNFPILPLLGVGTVVLLALAAAGGKSKKESDGTDDTNGSDDDIGDPPPDGEIDGDGGGYTGPVLDYGSGDGDGDGGGGVFTPNLGNFEICTSRDLSVQSYTTPVVNGQSSGGSFDPRSEYELPASLEASVLDPGVRDVSSYTGNTVVNYRYQTSGVASIPLQDSGAVRFTSALKGDDGNVCPLFPSARQLAEESPVTLIISTVAPPGLTGPSSSPSSDQPFLMAAETAASEESLHGSLRAIAVVPSTPFDVSAQFVIPEKSTSSILGSKGFTNVFSDFTTAPSKNSAAYFLRWGLSERMFWSSLGPQLGIQEGTGGNKALAKAFGNLNWNARYNEMYHKEMFFQTTVAAAVNRKANVAKMMVFNFNLDSITSNNPNIVVINRPTDKQIQQAISQLANWALNVQPLTSTPPKLTLK